MEWRSSGRRAVAVLVLTATLVGCGTGFEGKDYGPTSGPASTTPSTATSTLASTTPSTTRSTTPSTPAPPTTSATSIPLAQLSDFPVAVSWLTDLATTDPRRVAIENGLVVSLMTGLSGPPAITLAAFEDLDELDATYASITGHPRDPGRWANVSGTAYNQGSTYVIFVNVDEPDSNWFRGDLMGVIAHEWYHLHEYRTAPMPASAQWDGSASGGVGPTWLTEGASSWFAYYALERVGISILRFADGPRAALDHAPLYFPGLDALETGDGFKSVTFDAYGIALGAADLLAERAGAQALLVTYWHDRAASSASWRTVFADVFGITVDTFYAYVDAYVAGDRTLAATRS